MILHQHGGKVAQIAVSFGEARHGSARGKTLVRVAVFKIENTSAGNVTGGLQCAFHGGTVGSVQPHAAFGRPREDARVAMVTERNVVLIVHAVGDMHVDVERG